jgi:hypothetical protein
MNKKLFEWMFGNDHSVLIGIFIKKSMNDRYQTGVKCTKADCETRACWITALMTTLYNLISKVVQKGKN